MSPALVIALIALFVALGGTAGAVVTAAVPLAKHALTADKAKVADKAKLADRAKAALVADSAKKLSGMTASQLESEAAAMPSPASTASGLLAIKTGTWSVNPGAGGYFTVTCDSGTKVVSGGWQDPVGWAHDWDSYPTSDGTGWTVYIAVSPSAGSQQTGTLYAVCMK